MDDLARLLENVGYKELAKICGEEELPKSGKKTDLIKRLIEHVPEEKLRTVVSDFMGVAARMVEHTLVPKHRIMNETEIAELLARLGAKKWQLPKITDRDPMSMLLGAKPGDVLEITRNSQTAGEATYYRLVVRGGLQ
jgi:DNA-directed RNA polymerase subunit H